MFVTSDVSQHSTEPLYPELLKASLISVTLPVFQQLSGPGQFPSLTLLTQVEIKFLKSGPLFSITGFPPVQSQSPVGLSVGELGGESDIDGKSVSVSVGEELGPPLGTPLGTELGLVLGTEVGDALGLELGEELGMKLGEELGIELGAVLGEALGV